MQAQTSTTERWHFITAVLLPVVLALVATAAAVIGFVFWSTSTIDQRAIERQTTMVTQVLQGKRDLMLKDQGGIAIWDEAVIHTGQAFDHDWVHANMGLWMHNFFGHDRTMVLDAQDQPLYVMEDGQAVATTSFRDMASGVMPLVQQLRTLIDAGRMTDFVSGRAEAPPTVCDFALVDGKPAIVGVTPIVSHTRTLAHTPGTESLMVSVRFLGAQAVTEMMHQYLIEDAAFVLLPSASPDRVSYPVINDVGRFVAFFEWTGDRPGRLMLGHTVPVLIFVILAGALLFMLLLRKLRGSSAALQEGRRVAEHEAAHDRLTGLPNRTNFDTHLARILREQKAPSTNIVLLMLDLDRFKQVNDTLGHQAGDDLIRSVGERIRLVVGNEVMVARLGGDEFAILAVTHNRPFDAMAVSGRIIEAIGRPFDLGHFKAHVGVSIGIVEADASSAEPRELVRKADIALYEAKASGRNRAMVYEEHMNELLQLQHTIEGELRAALNRNDQLSVAFQPLVDQKTRKVIGAEALARWYHPKYGQISPARFIPVAENTGLIEELGEFVLRRACEIGASAPGRTIAVNISPTQLRNPYFSNQVFDILHQTGMRPIDLELEITESILLDDENISAQNLRTFRAAGIQIALDDFGTGYSSLSYLKRYPVDRIKIDRSFVSQLAEGHVSVAITQAIVTLAHAMDIEVTAEGVESEKQATILGKMGCNTLQGFLFSGAVIPAKIAGIFADPLNTPERRRRARNRAA